MSVQQSKYFSHIYPNNKTVYFGHYTTKNGKKIQHGNGFEYHHEKMRRNHLYIGEWNMGISDFGYLYSYNVNNPENYAEFLTYKFDENDNTYNYKPLSREIRNLKKISLNEIKRRIQEPLFTDFINHFKEMFPSLSSLQEKILNQLKIPIPKFTVYRPKISKKSRFSIVDTSKSSTGRRSGGSKKRKHRKRRTKAKKYN